MDVYGSYYDICTDGVRIASNTAMYTLLNKDFQLCINGVIYNVQTAPTGILLNLIV